MSIVNELLAQWLAILPLQSFAANAVIYLKFFNKSEDLQMAVAKLIQSRIASAGVEGIPGDLKRALFRALSKGK